MLDFDYLINTKIFFGKGKVLSIGSEIKKYGQRALLVYGQGSIKTNGIYDAVTKELKKHVASILDEVRNSHLAEGQDRIYIHGEKEAEARARNMDAGIDLDEATCEMLNEYGDKFGIKKLF